MFFPAIGEGIYKCFSSLTFVSAKEIITAVRNVMEPVRFGHLFLGNRGKRKIFRVCRANENYGRQEFMIDKSYGKKFYSKSILVSFSFFGNFIKIQCSTAS